MYLMIRTRHVHWTEFYLSTREPALRHRAVEFNNGDSALTKTARWISISPDLCLSRILTICRRYEDPVPCLRLLEASFRHEIRYEAFDLFKEG